MHLKKVVSIFIILFNIMYFYLPAHAISVEDTIEDPSVINKKGEFAGCAPAVPIPEDAWGACTNDSAAPAPPDYDRYPFVNDATVSTGYSDLANHTEGSIVGIAKSYWFSLISGLASVLGLLLAMYPVQIRSLSPSVFRSLVWKKTLLTSFGVGIIVFSGIQFYSQTPPPGGFFAVLYSILHGSKSYVPWLEGGTSVWGFMLIFGLIILWKAARLDPMRKIHNRLIEDGQQLRHSLERDLKHILDSSSYDKLSLENQYLYRQTLAYYEMVQTRIIDLIAGTSFNTTKYQTNLSALATNQIEDILNQIKNDMGFSNGGH